MRVPLSWLVEMLPGLAGVDAFLVAERLTRAGLEVEGIETTGGTVRDVVVGEVLAFDTEPQRNGKTVRWCQVRVDDGGAPRGIVCGAANFSVGDRVPVALPGALLPPPPGSQAPFAITARKTYGHVSDGMICSARELGAGEEAGGILVLPAQAPLGADVGELLGLAAETVLDVAVTPDRGYALSMRGIAREVATAFDLPFADPADAPMATAGSGEPGPPVRVADAAACDRYVARVVRGLDPTAVTPPGLQRRLLAAGMRPVRAAVDVTNLVLLGLGQPLHAFDSDAVSGALVVRRAEPGETLRTLDGVERRLHTEDVVIADDSGPVALAGVMGGAATEVTAATTGVLLESAHFDAVTVRRTAARHGLSSEASRRFERGVDDALAPTAAQAAVDMLLALAGGEPDAGGTDVDLRGPRRPITLPVTAAARKAGRDYDAAAVLRRLRDVGCTVADTGTDVLEVLPPSWRPDLTGAAELVEEVVRLEGYETVPSVLPRALPGRGLTRAQSGRRDVGRALAATGHVEVVVPPFLGRADLAALGLAADDARAHPSAVANPLSGDAGLLRTTLLPGLLRAVVRNVSRGSRDLAVFEVGTVFLPGAGRLPPAPVLPVDRRPDDAGLAALEAALPPQPLHVAVALTGARERAAWSGDGRTADWADAVEATRVVARAVGAALEAEAADLAPWHPGRCARLRLAGVTIGHAGELHPRVVATLGLPTGTCAAELDLDAVLAGVGGPVRAPRVSPYPAVGRDVALVVASQAPAAAVEAQLRSGAGELLEALWLFDSYAGEQVPAGSRSLAYRLTLRAPDRTLTDAEANAARDAAVAAVIARWPDAALRT